MKKYLNKVFMHLRQFISFGNGRETRWFNEEVISRIDKWFKEKGYCSSEQSMGDVADLFGISKEELSWYCRSTFGESFLSVRKDLRIHEARRLISERPDLPLRTIGEMVGINDKTNFRRQFYEVLGITPYEWRSRILELRKRNHRN